MGRASAHLARLPLGPGRTAGGARGRAGTRFEFQHVSIGNPQCVIEVGDELEQLDLAALGPPIEHSELFPNRTNVAFIRIDSEHEVRARIFERGVGETLSSGTGASGAAVAAVLRGAPQPRDREARRRASSRSRSSDQLDVTLTGWAEPVFAGEFSDEFMASAGGGIEDHRAPRAGSRRTCSPSSSARSSRSKAAGVDVISLGIGDPDMPTPAAHRATR